MKYKNTKTGAIIETSTEVSGENWELFDDGKSGKKKTPSKKQENSSDDNTQEGAE